MKNRIRALKIFFAVFALAILGRAVTLALGVDSRLAKLAKRQFKASVTVLPRRGYIFDRNGEGLAISLKVRSLFARPEILKKDLTTAELNHLAHGLSKVLGIPFSSVKSKLHSEKAFVWLKRQLSSHAEEAVRESFDLGEGLGLVEETQRFYPSQELASHVLGSVSVDGKGIEGLELLYEHLLRGENTRIASTKDAMGRRIFRDETGLLALRDGQSLVLTLDKVIQYETEKALREAVQEHQAKAGTAVVLDPRNGEVRALANYPQFDPNKAGASDLDSRRNRGVTDLFEPGSTFKPLVAAWAIDHGRPAGLKIDCEEGRFEVEDRVISEAESHEKYGLLTLSEILKFSSNVGAAKLSLEVGATGISQLLDRLELEKRTGIDLPGEAPGYVKRADLRSKVLVANIGFGQGLLANALQMASYYAAIANRGMWFQPRLVKAVLSEDPDSLQAGMVRYKLGAKIQMERERRLFSEATALKITEMLETVVAEKGTGTAAALEEWQVAGKTGTAQKIDSSTRRYSNDRFVASFAGFAPSKEPRFVVFVLLDEPKKKYYGGQVAAPAFAKIMRSALLRERISPDNNRASYIAQNQAALERIQESFSVSAIKKAPLAGPSLPIDVNAHPDLRGQSVRQALNAYRNHVVDIEVHGFGVLKRQEPAPGKSVAKGQKVKLYFE